MYLIHINFSTGKISSEAISFINHVAQQSLSEYGSNLPFIKTAKSWYTYGFINQIAGTSLSYNLLAVIDLGPKKSQTTLPLVQN